MLLEHLRQLEFPAGPGFAYVGGEFHTVAAVRALLIERGMDKDTFSAKAYWRANMANASHGEPVKE